ncbi:hypothetical protein JCM19046_124 [Bacillus sp. JCM 19046]|uniref:Transcriptional regulator with XRE-family HTH domain n=1 Tax=Shouchella xiaoxiensis TaxID=766895 RepID=A0ABS2SUT0_9BACI|nr:helix-turn-helix transcriptional regulator [Shouchella xiaoxiensis]MBM7839234.1 transcriptional regulator with XRE-family HTH domain [Shouchella xiaoxiensis]GAF13078.1 hypothetical protein JCM19045_2295 [Bacillus sp. JCM 19045]GAF15728.1 hypothetical protein JCM19046_124 [Bacillus sp. JCM 19046]
MKYELNRSDNTEIVTHNLERYEKDVIIHLHDVLKQRGLTISDLHRMTGIRIASLSELANARKYSVNIIHLVLIMQALRITDVTELFEVRFSAETKAEWAEEMAHYVSGLTKQQEDEVNDNLQRMNK